MFRRLTLAVVASFTALVPAVANAAISPDTGYGDAGMAKVVTDCTGTNLNGPRTKVGYSGRVYVLEQCSSGYHKVIAVGDDGEVDLGYANSGRVTFRIPAACLGEQSQLVAAKDGSVYGLFWGLSAPRGSQLATDLHVCVVRVTASGKLATQYGGSSAVRRLDRLGSDLNLLAGGAVDSKGRLLVFTHRISSIWQDTAVFVNRYTVAGKPDSSFSSDGQRAYTHPYQESLQWGGVVGDKPVVAISSWGGTDSGARPGTAFVRFDAQGALDRTFSGDGKLYVASADIAGARLVGSGIVVDDHLRIVYIAVGGRPDADARWLDLRRIGPTGRNDAAFAVATTKVQAPQGTVIPEPLLQVSAGRYVVNWEVSPSDDPTRSTGFNGNGTRWTGLGPNGTRNLSGPPFAPDRAAFYLISYRGGEGPDEVHLYRRLVQ